MKNKILIITLILCIVLAGAFADEIKVEINDEKLEFDVQPIVIDGSTMVPIRAIFETFGLDVGWIDETKTVTGTSDEYEIKLSIDNSKAYVNGVEVILDVPATIIDSRTLVPVRFISESVGAKVGWDQESKTVIISYLEDLVNPVAVGVDDSSDDKASASSKIISDDDPRAADKEKYKLKVDDFMSKRNALVAARDELLEMLEPIYNELEPLYEEYVGFESQYLELEEYLKNTYELYEFEKGDSCHAEFNEAGMIEGKAVYYGDDYKYIGDFVDSKFHGRGMIIWDNGDKYIGDFTNDSYNGYGYYYSVKYQYDFFGEYSYDLRNGKGIEIDFENNTTLTGIYRNDILSFNYKIVFEDGQSQYYCDRTSYGTPIEYTLFNSGTYRINEKHSSSKSDLWLTYYVEREVEQLREHLNGETVGEGMTYQPSTKLVYVGEFMNDWVEHPTAPTYFTLDENMFEFYDKVYDIIDDIYDERKSDRDNEIEFYKYVIKNSQYSPDYDDEIFVYQDHTAYGIIMNNYAVCEGYAEIMNILLNSCDIESAIVLGDAGYRKTKLEKWGGHSWNIVKVDGDYVFIDATWDDPGASKDAVGYNYFNKSGHYMTSSHNWDRSLDWIEEFKDNSN